MKLTWNQAGIIFQAIARLGTFTEEFQIEFAAQNGWKLEFRDRKVSDDRENGFLHYNSDTRRECWLIGEIK